MRGIVFSIGFLALVVAGCSRKVAPSSSTKVVVKDSIVYKEKIREVPVPVPGETVTFTKYIECDKVTNKPKVFSEKVQGEKAKVNASVDSTGKLTITGGCDSLTALVKVKDTEINRLRSEQTEKSETEIEYKTTKLDIFCRWYSGITLFLLVAFIGYKLKS